MGDPQECRARYLFPCRKPPRQPGRVPSDAKATTHATTVVATRDPAPCELPELPAAKRHRYADDLGLSQYDARVLTDERPMADYYEAVVAAGGDAKLSANWITGDLAAYVNSNRLSYAELPFRPEQLAEMVQLIDGGKISGKIAKEILPELLEKGGSPKAIVDERGLGMISDPAAIEAIVDELLTAHPDEVEAFRGGKNKLQGFFVGQLMKKTGGKADPKLANQILSRKLKGE